MSAKRIRLLWLVESVTLFDGAAPPLPPQPPAIFFGRRLSEAIVSDLQWNECCGGN